MPSIINRRDLFQAACAAVAAGLTAVRPAAATVPRPKNAHHVADDAWTRRKGLPVSAVFYDSASRPMGSTDQYGTYTRAAGADWPDLRLVTVYRAGFLIGCYDASGNFHAFGKNSATPAYVAKMARSYAASISIADDERDVMHWLTFRAGYLEYVDVTPRWPVMPDGWKMPERAYTDPSW